MPGDKKKRVVVGMSGGVDSSVAAWLLKEQGYDVVGVTMQVWQDEGEFAQEKGGCCGLSAVEDAGRVAGKLGIPYYVMDFKKEFREQVIDYFVEEYTHGRTPNPCIACNRCVKWGGLLSRSLGMGADYIATGHYARVERLANGRFALLQSEISAKDQTYALYSLTQEQLSHTLMPVGEYTKGQVRRIAEEAGLQVAQKPDSQEICFIPDHDHAKFIEEYVGVKSPPGDFVDKEGKVLGRHQGIIHYTVGQRKGLGLAMGQPVFVTQLCPEVNEVVVGTAGDVFTDMVICDKMNWMAIDGLHGQKMQVRAKIRYNHKGADCVIREVGEDTVECWFPDKVRAAAPGQAAVFYDAQGYVLGGGTIR